jgi:hypothetical protein
VSRHPSKILAFKRLTQDGNVRDLALTNRVKDRALKVGEEFQLNKLGPLGRPYFYVALATCLEVDVKYKSRVVMEAAGNEFAVFKRLYGETKIDLEMLFHVIDESITLSDLVSEAASVSDVPTLIGKHELILDVLSGTKHNLRQYFQKIADNEKNNELPQAALANLDEIAKDIEFIFQIRHAIVHDIYTGDGPLKAALKRKKMEDALSSCSVFLAMADRAFFSNLLNGVLGPRSSRASEEDKFQKKGKEVRRAMARLTKKFPASNEPMANLAEHYWALFSKIKKVLAVFEGRRNSRMTFSRHVVDSYFGGWMRLVRALELEGSLAVGGAYPHKAPSKSQKSARTRSVRRRRARRPVAS